MSVAQLPQFYACTHPCSNYRTFETVKVLSECFQVRACPLAMPQASLFAYSKRLPSLRTRCFLNACSLT
jgi:hypothetical protein